MLRYLSYSSSNLGGCYYLWLTMFCFGCLRNKYFVAVLLKHLNYIRNYKSYYLVIIKKEAYFFHSSTYIWIVNFSSVDNGRSQARLWPLVDFEFVRLELLKSSVTSTSIHLAFPFFNFTLNLIREFFISTTRI